MKNISVEDIIKLKNIIITYDDLINCWIEGQDANLVDEDIYSLADNLRNTALNILSIN